MRAALMVVLFLFELNHLSCVKLSKKERRSQSDETQR